MQLSQSVLCKIAGRLTEAALLTRLGAMHLAWDPSCTRCRLPWVVEMAHLRQPRVTWIESRIHGQAMSRDRKYRESESTVVLTHWA